jgi:hypothetical protein
MQTTVASVIIKSSGFRDSILTALADKEMMRILDCAMYRPTSFAEIVIETGIPQTTAYRKIKWLVQERLMIVASINITDDGKKSSLFRSTLRSFNVKYAPGEIVIEAEKNVDEVERTAQDFFSLNLD